MSHQATKDAVISEQDAGPYIGYSTHALRKWRREGTGPAYLQVGSRSIRYRVADLDNWLEQRRVEPRANR
jgi:predicted DNA-binding transcriptional regulator AlpA